MAAFFPPSNENIFLLQSDAYRGFQPKPFPKTEIDMYLFSQAAIFVCVQNTFRSNCVFFFHFIQIYWTYSTPFCVFSVFFKRFLSLQLFSAGFFESMKKNFLIFDAGYFGGLLWVMLREATKFTN